MVKPRISVALLYDHKLDFGGVERHLLAILRHADQSRFRYLVVSPVSVNFSAQARGLGGEVAPWAPRHSLLELCSLLDLIRLLGKNKISLLNIHSPGATAVGCLAARCLSIPAVPTVHLPAESYYRSAVPPLSEKLLRFHTWLDALLSVHFSAKIIFVSERMRRRAIAQTPRLEHLSQLIRNGIDPGPYQQTGAKPEVRQKLGVPRHARVICFVGRLDRQKGVDVLLKSARLLRSPAAPCLLLVVGDGEQKGFLQSQAKSERLGIEVRFLGYRLDVPDILAASDIFVLPSRWEAMPFALLEAMAAGLPCVATDVGDNAVMVQSGRNGFVVPAAAEDALAIAIQELLDNPELCVQMGNAGRRMVLPYNEQVMVKRIEQCFSGMKR
jgi:glycosyltransferase involved in cell wall biosynthesis